jgi:transcription antitermination factor NusG
MAASPIPEDQRQRFVQVLQEIDSPEALEWCREAVEERLAEVSAERARCLHKGDIVEVTEGPLAGNRGQVTARSCHAQDMVLVQFDELDLPEPLPIPAAALRRVAA